jgi:hypothetical protein
LKNHTRRNVDSSGATPSNVSKEFKDQLMQALLQVEFPVLKILVEVVRVYFTISNFMFVIDYETWTLTQISDTTWN